jgi:cytoskeletal protein CcmA (bactofilin family)
MNTTMRLLSSGKQGTGLLLLFLFVCMLAIPMTALSMPESGEMVSKRGTIDDDFYAAGGTVDINAVVAGDVVTAGGDLYIGHHIEGDVIAAGGTVTIRGEVLDDVRTAGGDITVDSIIGDDLIASGGRIKLSPDALVSGEAWLAGGDVYIGGTVNRNLNVGAGSVSIAGVVHGDVKVESGSLKILDGALISGDVYYRGPSEASIHPGSKITGQVHYEQVDWERPHEGMGIFFALSMIVASIFLFKLFPGFTQSTTDRLSTDPLKSMGAGLVIFIMIPVIAALLMAIVVGIWVGLSIMALYLVALITGLLMAFFALSDWSAGRFNIDVSSTKRRLLVTAIVIFIIALLGNIPVIGGLIMFVLLLTGLGAETLQLRAMYKQ